MTHQQPQIEPPATQAFPVQPGRSSQENTTSADSRVDVARLCERLDCLGDAFDALGIPRSSVAGVAPEVSIADLIHRIENLQAAFSSRDYARTAVAESANHIN